jgi:hypothetical protein
MRKYFLFAASMKRADRWAGLIMGLAISAFGTLSAAASLERAQETFQLRLPMTKLAPVQTTTLRGLYDDYFLKIPIPDRWEIHKARLHFSYVNSTALIPQNSRLVVRLNGHALAQVTLQPLAPVGDVIVSLPAKLLEPGYNELMFSASQHYVLDCEDPGAPELWTTLELDKSFIEFEYSLKKVPLQLRSVTDYLFDPRLTSVNRVNLVLEDLTPEQVQWAGIAASGIALRFDYRPVYFSLSHSIRPEMDNVLIGTQKFVTRLLGERKPSVQGAYVALTHVWTENPKDPKKVLEDPRYGLIIAGGETPDQVRSAVLTLASLSFPYPGTPTLEVKEIRLPAVEAFQGENMLRPGQSYSFEDLGMETHTFQGMGGPRRNIDFRLPTQLVPQDNDFLWLTLHLAYGSGMRKDSVLNVFFNGKYISSIFLDNPRGGIFKNYQIPIPAYSVKRGANTISFQAVLSPLLTGRCEFIQTQNLLLTLYGDSVMKIPPMSDWVDMPRMDLFFQDGFPFMRSPDGKDLDFFLTERNLDTAAAALNILGLIAQKIGYPAYQARFSFDPPTDVDREFLVVGRVQKIPDVIMKAAPMKVNQAGEIEYPQLKETAILAIEPSWIDRLMNFFAALPSGEKKGGALLTASSRQISGLGPQRAVLSEFRSPYRSGRSVLMMTAQSSQELYAGSLALWEPALQGRIAGDLTIFEIQPPDYRSAHIAVGGKYYLGTGAPLSRLNAFLYGHPWIFLGSLIAALVILSLGIYWFLKKIRRRRLRHGEL